MQRVWRYVYTYRRRRNARTDANERTWTHLARKIARSRRQTTRTDTKLMHAPGTRCRRAAARTLGPRKAKESYGQALALLRATHHPSSILHLVYTTMSRTGAVDLFVKLTKFVDQCLAAPKGAVCIVVEATCTGYKLYMYYNYSYSDYRTLT
jgi:hypothetical protein